MKKERRKRHTKNIKEQYVRHVKKQNKQLNSIIVSIKKNLQKTANTKQPHLKVKK